MWAYSTTSELYHYGVLGMQWGKRKAIRDYATNARNKAAAGIKKGYNRVANSKQGSKAISGVKNYNTSQKEKAQKRLDSNKQYGKNAKAVAVAKEAGKGAAREVGIIAAQRLAGAGVMALAMSGHVKSAAIMGNIAGKALTAVEIANAAYTGKNIAYTMMAKNK